MIRKTTWLSVLTFLAACTGGNAPAPGEVGNAGAAGTAAQAGSGGSDHGASGGEAGIAGYAGQVVDKELVINEIYPSGDIADPDHPTDWVELKNIGEAPFELDGYVVAQNYDGTALPVQNDQVPLSGEIAAGGYLIVTTSNDAPGAMGSFGISTKKQERITLFDPAGIVLDDTTTDGSDAEPFAKGSSWARFPDGTGAFARRPETRSAANVE